MKDRNGSVSLQTNFLYRECLKIDLKGLCRENIKHLARVHTYAN